MRLAVHPIGNLLDCPTLAVDRALDQLLSDRNQVFALGFRVGLVQRGAQGIDKRLVGASPQGISRDALDPVGIGHFARKPN